MHIEWFLVHYNWQTGGIEWLRESGDICGERIERARSRMRLWISHSRRSDCLFFETALSNKSVLHCQDRLAEGRDAGIWFNATRESSRTCLLFGPWAIARCRVIFLFAPIPLRVLARSFPDMLIYLRLPSQLTRLRWEWCAQGSNLQVLLLSSKLSGTDYLLVNIRIKILTI